MAAWVWIVAGMAAMLGGGGVAGYLIGGAIARAPLVISTPAPPAPSPESTLLDEVVRRMLDLTLPARPEGPELDEQVTQRSGAEYEPPIEPMADWTDPFIGVERPLIARLAPGQGIPGIGNPQADQNALTEWQEKGSGAFDEWARDTMLPDPVRVGEMGTSWVPPVDLGDGVVVE